MFVLPATAATDLRLPDSRIIPVVNQAAAVSYFFGTGVPNNYVVDAQLDNFLFCNEFGAANGAANTASFESVYLRPRYGAWVFGRADSEGVMGSFTGIKGATYADGTLNIDACPADGSDCAASTGNLGAALQCYTADAHGESVADTRDLFADNFEGSYDNAPNNSWVSIRVTHMPVSQDDTLDYEISVHLPPTGGARPDSTGGSQSNSAYILKEGYDTALFSSCSVLLPDGGQLITASTTTPIQRTCKMYDFAANLPTDVPVVSAALFTNAATKDVNYSDNVAFGYPVVTGSLATLSVLVTTAGGEVSATGGATPMGGAISQCDIATAGAANCKALYTPGDAVQLTATSAPGYAFTGWGNACASATGTTANVTVAGDMACSASFTSLHYAINATSGGNGSITPATQSVLYGGSASFNVTPDAHYHIATVTGDTCTPTAAPGNPNQYLATNIQSACNVTATFAVDQVTVTIAGQYQNGFLIRSGDQTPSNSYTADFGSTLVLNATAFANYYFAGATGCNGVADTQSGTYTINPVTADCTVTSNFAPVQFAVTATSAGNGTITPASQNVAYQGTANFTVTPDTGYHVDTVAGDNCTVSGSGSSYTATITAACAVTASFAADQ